MNRTCAARGDKYCPTTLDKTAPVVFFLVAGHGSRNREPFFDLDRRFCGEKLLGIGVGYFLVKGLVIFGAALPLQGKILTAVG